MVFDELFALLWDLSAEERQALAMRLLNYLGPVTQGISSELAGEEKFDQIVAHFARYPDEGERVREISDLLVFLVSDHRVWAYANIAIQSAGDTEDEQD